MKQNVLWQIVVASVLGAVAGLTTALVYNFNWLIGLLVGTSVGFITCAPWEVLTVAKSVFFALGGCVKEGFKELAQRKRSDWLATLHRVVSVARGSVRCTIKTVRFFGAGLVRLMVVTWWAVALAFVPICLGNVIIWKVVSFPNVEAKVLGSILLIIIWLVLTLGLSIGLLVKWEKEERKLSVRWPMLWFLAKWLDSKCQEGAAFPEGCPEWGISFRAGDGTIFRFERFSRSFLMIASAWWCTFSVMVLFPLFLVADTFLTIFLALATTKRLASTSGAVCGYLSGLAWHGAGGGLGGAYAVAVGVALVFCGLYFLHQSLSEQRWPFQRQRQQLAN
jgi:hypothetical protein